MNSLGKGRNVLAIAILLAAALFGGGAGALFGVCGPFTDVAADAFCPFVLEIFTLGITTGTTPTTYDPASTVSRLQMAAFLSRTADGVLKRGSRRAALNQFWKTGSVSSLSMTTLGNGPRFLRSDGADVWVSNLFSSTVSRVRASDGKLLETWTGASAAQAVVVALGRVFVTSFTSPGKLSMIDPAQAAGAVTTVATNLGVNPLSAAFDGVRIWTANFGSPGSVSIITPGATIPWTVTTVPTGFQPLGSLYDGANVWVPDSGANTLLKLDSSGAILQTVTVGFSPQLPVFDGSNIWVSNFGPSSVSVVRASTGAVIQTLTGNGLSNPIEGAFDGERILITSQGDTVSLWKAADLTPLGFFSTGAGTTPLGVCSDGVNFWIALSNAGKLLRF